MEFFATGTTKDKAYTFHIVTENTSIELQPTEAQLRDMRDCIETILMTKETAKMPKDCC